MSHVRISKVNNYEIIKHEKSVGRRGGGGTWTKVYRSSLLTKTPTVDWFLPNQFSFLVAKWTPTPTFYPKLITRPSLYSEYLKWPVTRETLASSARQQSVTPQTLFLPNNVTNIASRSVKNHDDFAQFHCELINICIDFWPVHCELRNIDIFCMHQKYNI